MTPHVTKVKKVYYCTNTKRCLTYEEVRYVAGRPLLVRWIVGD